MRSVGRRPIWPPICWTVICRGRRAAGLRRSASLTPDMGPDGCPRQSLCATGFARARIPASKGTGKASGTRRNRQRPSRRPTIHFAAGPGTSNFGLGGLRMANVMAAALRTA